MMPQGVASPVDGYVNALRGRMDGRVAAVYAVGSLALDDFSDRQSNVDLVVVCDPPLDASERRALRRAEKRLGRAGRDPELWYTTWEEVSGGPRSVADPDPSPLATPLTWGILREDPMPLVGPDWPVVWSDEGSLKAWALGRLHDMARGPQGLLLFRRHVAPFVLEAARLAQAAITGRILSKSEAGDAATNIVSSRNRRVLVDAVGYRNGAQTSMYWGPFERKYDALAVVRELAEAAGG